MKSNAEISFQTKQPTIVEISDFIESFWSLQNEGDIDKAIILLPDGRIDLV